MGRGCGDYDEETTKFKEATAHPPPGGAPEKRSDSNHADADEKAKYLYWSSNEANKLCGGNYDGTSNVRNISKEMI